jgi:hypothetical protein
MALRSFVLGRIGTWWVNRFSRGWDKGLAW